MTLPRPPAGWKATGERTKVETLEDLASLDDDEVIDGYRDGLEGLPCGDNRSRSYWHGWRNARVDSGLEKPDDAQQRLAAEVIAATTRPADERYGTA